MTRHLKLLGGALQKSTCDSFEYALRLRTGEMIVFGESTYVSGDWIHLENATAVHSLRGPSPDAKSYFPRGIDVRISDIVWVMDAPFGS